ncbi:DUF2220 family protein [Arthrobacter tumbae]|uniref:Wadjet anti-phage system protein JetD domain-containing protein n=1 Tax=Arthrobacter tumbae TaxID=163874 RepID=UPI00195CAE40|nr:Wadjet anti-phage system protein JetD domain-containing protein [Arthrobacter tumbae]MBM7782282.1 hypothetical protein [Arthrobacter tumbae]
MDTGYRLMPGAAKPWIGVEQARTTAAGKYERNFGEWAAAGGAGVVVVEFPLHPPTEQAALANQGEAIAWVKSWREAGLGDAVVWAPRRWASLGTQQVPERLRITGAVEVARFARKAQHWSRLSARVQALLSTFDRGTLAEAVRRSARRIAELDDVDFDRLVLVLQWLEANPQSGLYIRQLPVRGVDTKWVSTHRGLVEKLFAALTGRESLGLGAPPALVRMRFLDPELSPGGLVDVSVPVSELASLDIQPRTVFVFENLESVIAMPPVPGAVVLHGAGYAVDRLERIPWVRDGRVVYWGDLDSHGFGILNRIRSACSDVSPVLMDVETLEAYRDLWVKEPVPSTGTFSHLLPAEQHVMAELKRHGNVRLEQERIEWRYALERLLAMSARAASTC